MQRDDMGASGQSWWREWVPPVALFVLVVISWHGAVVAFKLPPVLLPGPGRVAEACWRMRLGLLSATGYTACAAISGWLLSFLWGTAIGIVFAHSRWLRTSMYPYAIFLQTVPVVAIAPLVIIWFGRGFASVVLVALILSLFPIITNATAGLLSVHPDQAALFQLYQATRWQTLWKLRMPLAIPSLCTGARTSSGLAIVGAIVGEFFTGTFGSQHGLGYLIHAKQGQMAIDELFAAILCATGLGIAMFAVISSLGDAITARWRGPVAS